MQVAGKWVDCGGLESAVIMAKKQPELPTDLVLALVTGDEREKQAGKCAI